MNTALLTLGLRQALRLSPAVVLRPEPFGALAYHFGNRRLTFLKRPELVHVVRLLDSCATVEEALREAGIDEQQWPAYVEALQGLAAADMVREQAS